ncbi:ribosome silencing factor [Aureibacillus halotolerans]|uniref:Ribosomal silencing factor RsfS n=1 Tax=Aureibacillus halotolerans TaxID=1508390 RepID=A0A4R6U4T1_9BACI|nr:ribosome silencing factor [Aureibacillus halotolerans]TDQ38034.1 ribosome-associated protein [Aureibacillus halotolerans]
MTETQLLQLSVQAADDKKAHEIVVLNMKGISLVADYFLICHGNSEKQVQAIASGIREKALGDGLQVHRIEGYDHARWVLVDLGDVVCHIFHSEERHHYQLEKLWGDASYVNIDSFLEPTQTAYR